MTDIATKPISVVIPSYNGKELLASFLPSVFHILRDKDEVLIVDDHSTDATVPWLTDRFKLVQNAEQKHTAAFALHQGWYRSEGKKITVSVIANNQNVRFGQAANRGIELARHRYILLLNSDVKPLPGVVEALLPHFSDPEVFGVGCLEIEDTKEDSKRWGGKNQLWFARGMFIHSRAKEFNSGPTAWVSGGSGMFDKEKWNQLNGFDAAYYPAYWEDIDLSYRARKKGWKVLFEANAKVEHHHETTNQDVFGQARIDAMSWKNAVVFVWKNATITQLLLHVFWKPYWWWKRSKTV